MGTSAIPGQFCALMLVLVCFSWPRLTQNALLDGIGWLKASALYSLFCPQGSIFRLTCSFPELTKDHVLTSAYVKIFRSVTRNAVNNSAWRKKDCS